MIDVIDYSEVPYLKEVLEFLPIDAKDKRDISSYIRNITNSIAVNYIHEQYQFAYFGLHLLFMTYIYSTVWKISQIKESRYSDVVVFAKPYKNKTIDFFNIESVFEYSIVPEKELPKILNLINLDDSKIKKIVTLVNLRNDMAHASGTFEISTENAFWIRSNSLYDLMNSIHSCMDSEIRNWFNGILLKYANGEFDSYSEVHEFISEQMVQSFCLSVNEVLVCNEASARDLISSNLELKDKFLDFKQKLKSYCYEKQYI